MRESETFLAILDEGREIQTRLLIRDFAEAALGQPDEQSLTRLEGTTDIDRLVRMCRRAAKGSAVSWPDLLDTL